MKYLIVIVLLIGCSVEDGAEWLGVDAGDTEIEPELQDYSCGRDECVTDEDCDCVAAYCLPDSEELDFNYLTWSERPEYDVEPGTCVVADCIPGEQYTCPESAGHWNKELTCHPTPQDIIDSGADAGLEIPSHICGY